MTTSVYQHYGLAKMFTKTLFWIAKKKSSKCLSIVEYVSIMEYYAGIKNYVKILWKFKWEQYGEQKKYYKTAYSPFKISMFISVHRGGKCYCIPDYEPSFQWLVKWVVLVFILL